MRTTSIQRMLGKVVVATLLLSAAIACSADLQDFSALKCDDFSDAYKSCRDKQDLSYTVTSNDREQADEMCKQVLMPLGDPGYRCLTCVATTACDKVVSECSQTCPTGFLSSFVFTKPQ